MTVYDGVVMAVPLNRTELLLSLRFGSQRGERRVSSEAQPAHLCNTHSHMCDLL